MTKEEALKQYYNLMQLESSLRLNGLHDLAWRTVQLADDIRLAYHISGVEVQRGII